MVDDDPRTYAPRRPGKLFTLGWLSAVALVLVATGALVLARELRVQRQTEQLERAIAQGRRVLVTHPHQGAPMRSLEVPATIHGFVETPIYAKIAGYVKTISVDKGDRVSEGQIIAVLDSPEIDQQVANARASYDVQAVTNRRNQELAREGIIAQQAADEANGAMLQAKASLDQLEAMRGYETVRAPFAGIVTSRNVDPGALVAQATAPTGSLPIVTLATLTPLRVYAEVPQSLAPHVRNGDRASISVTEYPDREFEGSVARRADALQPSTRTMLVEVDLPNDDSALYPGMYAKVSFTVSVPGGPPQVPADALIFRDGKVYVPVVRNNRLELSEVSLGYDDGRMVEVTSGIGANDLIAINVGQAVHSGEVVQPVAADTH